jgi:hypothetical protein
MLLKRSKLLLLPVCIGLLLGFSSCSTQTIVHVIDPTSACARLRTAYPSEHGLVLFPDSSSSTRSIPWCFPGVTGFGVIGYNINISVPRAGALTLILSDIRPPTQFAAVSVNGSCAGDNTGKSIVRLGYGTQWLLPDASGDYCISLITAEKSTEDVWFTLTATRP